MWKCQETSFTKVNAYVEYLLNQTEMRDEIQGSLKASEADLH